MAKSTEQKQTQTTQSSNPAVNSMLTKLAGGIEGQYQPGKSLYVAPGANTTAGQGASLASALDPTYAGGVSGAMSSYANRAAGNELGINDPLYAAQRERLTDDVLTDVNSMFTTSGRFGSGSHVGAASEGLAGALGALDTQQRNESYGRQTEGANMLSSLFAAGQMPGAVQQDVGAAQDASAQGAANGQTDYLAKLLGLTSGAAGASGTTTTQTTPAPSILQQLLGAAAVGSGIFGNVAGGMGALK